MTKKEYYVTKIIYKDQAKLLIYISGEKDSYLTDEHGVILTFDTLPELVEFGLSNSFNIDEEEAVIPCIEQLCPDKQATDDILNFWNVCTDIAYTVGEQFLGDKRKPIINTVYSKLFAGSDVPTIRGDNPPYFPVWTRRERRVANKVLANGIELVKKYVF